MNLDGAFRRAYESESTIGGVEGSELGCPFVFSGIVSEWKVTSFVSELSRLGYPIVELV